MAHFAHVDPNTSLVTQVIVIEPDVLEASGGWPINGVFCDKVEFVQCSYNTQNGVHSLGGTPLRKNYPGVNWTYDINRDAFIPPKPDQHPSWVVNENTCQWEPPKPRPTTPVQSPIFWSWDEVSQDWVQKTLDLSDPKVRNQCVIDGNCTIDPVTGEIIPKS